MIKKVISVFTLFFYVFIALDLSSVAVWGMEYLRELPQEKKLLIVRATRDPKSYRRLLQHDSEVRTGVELLLTKKDKEKLPPFINATDTSERIVLHRAFLEGSNPLELGDESEEEKSWFTRVSFKSRTWWKQFLGEFSHCRRTTSEKLYIYFLDTLFLVVGFCNAANIVLISYDLKIPTACVSFGAAIVELGANFVKKIHDRRQAEREKEHKQKKRKVRQNYNEKQQEALSLMQVQNSFDHFSLDDSTSTKAYKIKKGSSSFLFELAADGLFALVALLNFVIIILTINDQSSAAHSLSIASLSLQTLGVYFKKAEDKRYSHSYSKRKQKIAKYRELDGNLDEDITEDTPRKKSSVVQPIQMKDGEKLPARNRVFELYGKPSEDMYHFGDKDFRLQNVSGDGLNCFFNCVGLKREGALEALKSRSHDERVRFIIANDIMTALYDPDQLSKKVKGALNYSGYLRERQRLEDRRRRRNEKLAELKEDEESQNDEDLPKKFQANEIKQDERELNRQMKIRASSREAFLAYVNEYIGKGEMMPFHPDVKGDRKEKNVKVIDSYADYTAVDVIAFIYDFGLMIFDADGQELRLTHTFIPQSAKELAYLYYAENHFQLLIPATEALPDQDGEEDPQEKAEQKKNEEGDYAPVKSELKQRKKKDKK